VWTAGTVRSLRYTLLKFSSLRKTSHYIRGRNAAGAEWVENGEKVYKSWIWNKLGFETGLKLTINDMLSVPTTAYYNSIYYLLHVIALSHLFSGIQACIYVASALGVIIFCSRYWFMRRMHVLPTVPTCLLCFCFSLLQIEGKLFTYSCAMCIHLQLFRAKLCPIKYSPD